MSSYFKSRLLDAYVLVFGALVAGRSCCSDDGQFTSDEKEVGNLGYSVGRNLKPLKHHSTSL